MSKSLEAGQRVRITQQYVNNVGPQWKAEAQLLVGEEGVLRELRKDVWAVDLDKGPHIDGLNYLFYPNELEVL